MRSVVRTEVVTKACRCCDPKCREILRSTFTFYDDGTFDVTDEDGVAMTIYQPNPPSMSGLTVGVNSAGRPVGLESGGSLVGRYTLPEDY